MVWGWRSRKNLGHKRHCMPWQRLWHACHMWWRTLKYFQLRTLIHLFSIYSAATLAGTWTRSRWLRNSCWFQQGGLIWRLTEDRVSLTVAQARKFLESYRQAGKEWRPREVWRHEESRPEIGLWRQVKEKGRWRMISTFKFETDNTGMHTKEVGSRLVTGRWKIRV